MSWDAFPAGDHKGRSSEQLLRRLRDQLGVQNYYFLHVDGSGLQGTRNMVDEFRRQIGDNPREKNPWLDDSFCLQANRDEIIASIVRAVK